MGENKDNRELVTGQLIEEQDPEKAKRIVNLFNLNIAKKNALRLNSINELLDTLLEQVGTRLEKCPDEFSNKDLIDYLNALYNAAEKSNKAVNSINELPAITINQQNNIIVDPISSLSIDSRRKILDVMSALLNEAQNSTEVIEIDESTETNSGRSTDDPN